MLLKHSLSLLITNVGIVFKVLIYSFVVFLVGYALLISILEPISVAIGQTLNVQTLIDGFIKDLASGGTTEIFKNISETVDNFAHNHPDMVVNVSLLSALLLFAVKYFFALIVCPVAYLLNHKMSTNFTEGFFHSLVSVGFKGVGTASLYTLISAPFDTLVVVGAFFLGKALSLAMGIVGVLIAVVSGLLLITVRLTIMGQWVAVIMNENIKFNLQMKRGFMAGFKGFKKTFPAMLTLVLVIFGIITTTALPTAFIIPIVAVPVAIVWFVSIHLVAYFRANDREYYSE